mmetsp:Transcript_9627/g.37480  ORF Transcript_9627/g.37480 Transcript_9627/m.37480 type:complete len:334 (-) Transcript_9627:100-1101(-)
MPLLPVRAHAGAAASLRLRVRCLRLRVLGHAVPNVGQRLLHPDPAVRAPVRRRAGRGRAPALLLWLRRPGHGRRRPLHDLHREAGRRPKHPPRLVRARGPPGLHQAAGGRPLARSEDHVPLHGLPAVLRDHGAPGPGEVHGGEHRAAALRAREGAHAPAVHGPRGPRRRHGPLERLVPPPGRLRAPPLRVLPLPQVRRRLLRRRGAVRGRHGGQGGGRVGARLPSLPALLGRGVHQARPHHVEVPLLLLRGRVLLLWHHPLLRALPQRPGRHAEPRELRAASYMPRRAQREAARGRVPAAHCPPAHWHRVLPWLPTVCAGEDLLSFGRALLQP